MNNNNRRNSILKMLQTVRAMPICDIILKFNASPSTIRKDLTYLEQKGFITRTRGLAHFVNETAPTAIALREAIRSEEKKKIAQIVVSLIENDDTIILDSGSTTSEIAKAIKHFNDLTVVTNSVEVANVLCDSNINVLMSGGILKKPILSLVGPDTEAFFNRIEVSKLFLSANGVRSTIGLTTTSPFEHNVKRNMIKAAQKVYAVLDSSKFQTTSIDLFCDFSEIDCIITDKPIENQELAKKFKQLDIEILCEVPSTQIT
jgi:DeoR/GlpR family transcriptional regulator of sugar metabolism